MSPATVRSAIKCLELAGIISVQRHNGGSNTITLTPHTEWVVSNFRELRAPSKKQRQRVSPTPATPSPWVVNTPDTTNTPPDTDTPATVVVNTTDTPATPSPWVEDTRYPYRVLTNTPDTDTTNTPATPSADIVTPSADTDTTPTPDTPATARGGNGKPILKRKVSPTPATNTPPATPSPYTTPPEADSLRFNNDKNGKKLGKKLGVSPTPDTPATNITDTPPTPTPATPSADTDTTPDTDTPI